MAKSILGVAERALLLEARRIVMCTIGPDGSPRPVPICFALMVGAGDGASERSREGSRGEVRLYTPLDEKPKSVADPHRLARVRDIAVRPEVTLLADRWDEDWDRLAWLRLHGVASLLEPAPEQGSGSSEHAAAVAALLARYPQYASYSLRTRPIIRVVLTAASSWGLPG